MTITCSGCDKPLTIEFECLAKACAVCMERTTICPSEEALIFVDEGLGYCRHDDRAYVLFYSIVEPPFPAFSSRGVWFVGRSDDEPTAIDVETSRVRRAFIEGNNA